VLKLLTLRPVRTGRLHRALDVSKAKASNRQTEITA